MHANTKGLQKKIQKKVSEETSYRGANSKYPADIKNHIQ